MIRKYVEIQGLNYLFYLVLGGVFLVSGAGQDSWGSEIVVANLHDEALSKEGGRQKKSRGSFLRKMPLFSPSEAQITQEGSSARAPYKEFSSGSQLLLLEAIVKGENPLSQYPNLDPNLKVEKGLWTRALRASAPSVLKDKEILLEEIKDPSMPLLTFSFLTGNPDVACQLLSNGADPNGGFQPEPATYRIDKKAGEEVVGFVRVNWQNIQRTFYHESTYKLGSLSRTQLPPPLGVALGAYRQLSESDPVKQRAFLEAILGLLKKKADPNVLYYPLSIHRKNLLTLYNPLLEACRGKSLKMIRRLLKVGADPLDAASNPAYECLTHDFEEFPLGRSFTALCRNREWTENRTAEFWRTLNLFFDKGFSLSVPMVPNLWNRNIMAGGGYSSNQHYWLKYHFKVEFPFKVLAIAPLLDNYRLDLPLLQFLLSKASVATVTLAMNDFFYMLSYLNPLIKKDELKKWAKCKIRKRQQKERRRAEASQGRHPSENQQPSEKEKLAKQVEKEIDDLHSQIQKAYRLYTAHAADQNFWAASFRIAEGASEGVNDKGLTEQEEKGAKGGLWGWIAKKWQAHPCGTSQIDNLYRNYIENYHPRSVISLNTMFRHTFFPPREYRGRSWPFPSFGGHIEERKSDFLARAAGDPKSVLFILYGLRDEIKGLVQEVAALKRGFADQVPYWIAYASMAKSNFALPPTVFVKVILSGCRLEDKPTQNMIEEDKQRHEGQRLIAKYLSEGSYESLSVSFGKLIQRIMAFVPPPSTQVKGSSTKEKQEEITKNWKIYSAFIRKAAFVTETLINAGNEETDRDFPKDAWNNIRNSAFMTEVLWAYDRYNNFNQWYQSRQVRAPGQKAPVPFKELNDPFLMKDLMDARTDQNWKNFKELCNLLLQMELLFHEDLMSKLAPRLTKVLEETGKLIELPEAAKV